MLRQVVAVAAVANAVRLSTTESAQANPMRKVVTALQNMEKEIGAEGEKEEKLYNKFVCWAEKMEKEGSEGNAAKAAAAEAAAQKSKEAAAQHAQLLTELEDHKNDREEAKQAIADASALRAKEKAAYDQEVGDDQKDLDGLARAIKAISSGMSLIQANVAAPLRSIVQRRAGEFDRETLMAFLEEKNPYGAYQSSSGEIVGILKTMKDQMEKDLGGIVATEKEAVKSFNALMAAKEKEIAGATAAIESKTQRAGELAVEKVEAKNDAENMGKEAATMATMLADLENSKKEKEAEFNDRQAVRADELKAINDAISILNDDDALEIFKSTLPTPKAPTQPAFLQMSSVENARQRALQFVQVKSTSKINHVQLALLMNMLKSKKVSFDKVLQMIDDMVVILGEEQSADEKQLDTCTVELDSAADERKELARATTRTTNKLEKYAASIDALKAELKELASSLVNLDQSVATATEQRKAENEEFKSTKIQNGAAVQLIEKAKNRLNKFYNPALYKAPKKRELTEEERIQQSLGVAPDQPQGPVEMIPGTNIPALVQQSPSFDGQPETASGAYGGKAQKSNAVIALLDKMVSEIKTDMTKADSEEKNSQKEYEEFMGDSKAARKENVATTTEKDGCLSKTLEAQSNAEDKKAGLEKETAANAKLDADLHTKCDFLIKNFDVRKEARTAEVEGLKNAKAILHGANFA